MDNQEKLRKRLEKMKARYEDERGRVKAYEQIVKMYSAYMAVLLNALSAVKDKPFKLKHSEITKGLEEFEVRAIPSEAGFDMYVEKKEKENVK